MPLWATVLGAAAWGAIWGSFANVVAWRWPRGESLARPGSHCPHCAHPIRWHDNIPVLSWLLLGGRCRDCRGPIASRYAMVELTSALLAAAVWHRLASDAIAVEGTIEPGTLGRFMVEFHVLWGLLTVSLVDLETLLVPDVVVLPLVILALAGQALFPEGRLLRNAIAAAAGYAVVHVVFVLGWRLLTGHEGMGLGDGKILALIGAHLGPAVLPFALVAGALQGLAYVVVVMAVLRRSPTPPGADEPAPESVRETKVPFGPFLALAAIEAVFLAPLLAPHVSEQPILRIFFLAWG